ncbi:hypothetical protein PVA8_122 [Vibrio phage PVA8]|nr:hypothetical protein [Vibrio phage PC-Liy1]URQ03108.1 hypothetical protein PVA8_122 [Vibrio phage PVA8]WBM58844.1 hypothetical protein vBValMPVA8_122 [Vibrio phage vB_ValM_PVA8]
MAELRSTTAIGGNIVWHGGNLRFDPQGETIRYQGYKIYTEHDTPLPGELGNGGTTSAFTKAESDARFAPIAGGGYVQKIGDTMTGKLTNTANEIEIRGGSPRLLLQDNDGTKRWYLINDGGNFSLRENDTATTRFRIDAAAANFGIENIDINSKTAFRGFDSWLRINDQAAFTTGVYFGSSLVRTDGTLQVGSATASGFVVNTTAIKYKDNNVFHDGYHPNADKWTTARTLTTTLTGDVSGSASMTIDGSANATVTVTATVANDSHTHDGRYYTETESDARFANVAGDTFTGNVAISKAGGRLSFNETNYQTDNSGINWITSASQNLELIHEITDGDINTSGGNGQALIIRQNGGVGSPAGLEVEGEIFAKVNQRVFHDAYHPNADKWTTARTLTLNGDVSGSVSIDGSANATMTVTVANDSHTHDGRYYTEAESDARFANVSGDTFTGRILTPYLSNISTSNLDTAGDGSGYSFMYATSTATNKPSGQDHAVLTQSYSDLWQTQLASDWRLNKWFVRTQENGTWKSWAQIFTDIYHPNADTWTTARTLTVGNTGKSVNGSANVAWSLSEIGAVSKSGDTINGQLTIRHTNVQLNLMDSTYSDNYWQLDHQNGVMAFRYNGSASDDFRLNENGTAVFAHSVTAPTFVGSLSGNATSATTATYLGSSLISSNGGQDFKIRNKRALVGTTSNLIVNYGNDFTDVTVQSALLSTGRMTAYGSAASYAYASHYTSQAPFYHYKSSSGTSEYHAFMKGDINHSGGRYQHSFGAILSSSGAHTAQIVSSLNSSTTKQWSFQYSTGNFTAPGNVTAYSDRRLKKNIKLIDNALNKVGELNGYTYDKRSSFDSDEYIRETGVIAQEVEKVLPEAVMESDDEERILSVAYGNMNGLLIEAIKELNAKVDTLQNEVHELKRPWWKKLLRL